jgi:ABC-2 type transport system ATP-binding protein
MSVGNGKAISGEAGAPAKVRIENLVKLYQGKTALDGISLTVNEGEVYGFIGPNGAGKTTTMSILVGLIHSDGGTCEIDGELPGARGQVKVGYLPEEPSFAEHLTGKEYLSMIAATMRLPHAQAEVSRLLGEVALADAADRKVSGYSRGMRQRLGIACAVLGDPELLILDEPSSALDPEGRKAVVDLILALKAGGKTVFLSTHILSDIERICDRIALIDKGRIMLEGAMPELLEEGLSNRIDIQLSRSLAEREGKELAKLPFVESFETGNGGSAFSILAKPGNPTEMRIALVRKLGELSLPLVSLSPRKASLEEIFLAKVARHE